jgi:RNA polymerase sigma factor for flagellar operon FliA
VEEIPKFSIVECETTRLCSGVPISDPDFLLQQLSWVRNLAKQMHRHLPSSVPIEDLVSAGVIGLLVAICSFDASRHVQFQCYARTRVRGAIVDSLRESDWAPRALRRKSRQVSDAYHQLSMTLGHSPSETELANKLGITLRELQALKRDLDGLNVSSLDEIPPNKSRGTPVHERVAGSKDDIPYNKYVRTEIHHLLEDAIANMPESARRVVIHYYFDEMTMKEVGAVLGIGESRVSQLHRSAVDLLRKRILESTRSPLQDPHQQASVKTPDSKDGASVNELESEMWDQVS